ncbi:Protein O-GlcNAcase [Bagarius yarrelli]|uniref:protein O-GlcNAcase n=1 Tax=Bagarius yarrelli TaxID=175774 RepID=A0A556U687_BAGYA|nr:Protein O-GlcNAcase [Bagarius yarrelli]
MDLKEEFLCGVVEGFYGRPWSMEQRKVLFQWMQTWGLNTYLYGPKDDLKHRLLWREVYSAEEEAQLKALVHEAQSRGLRFVYSLSPGQDIVFSSSSDLKLLKRKLRQVAELGCQAFAILFDDIDHSMCQADTEAFSSFAYAQVSVTNEIYRFLGEPPVFLFCPTEYCSSLCSPSVSKSQYLLTVGEDLLHGISVIWTGSKVISHELSADSLIEVQSVLQRPPLVWDNLHANDYDSRRVFLGPFKGRPPGLQAYLRGLLLNPNCEFEANYIPLHTLGTWHKAGKEKSEGKAQQYCPERALSTALKDWMTELNQPLQPGRQQRFTEPKPSTHTSKPNPPESLDNLHEAQSKPPSAPGGQVSSSTPVLKVPTGTESEERPSGGQSKAKVPEKDLCAGKSSLSEAQVRLLVGLYFLPYEHGPPAQSLLQALTWLKSHCHYVSVNGSSKKMQQQKIEEWRMRAGRFLVACDEIAALHGGVGRVISESSPLGSWKNCFHCEYLFRVYAISHERVQACAVSGFCSTGCGASSGAELFSVEAEPWVFKGGLSGEVQMLLPVGTSSELFSHPPPLFPTSRLYNIRPFQHKDKMELYRMVCQLSQKNRGAQDVTVLHPDFIGDRLQFFMCLGASLALCPEYSFVLEDELGVCGCVAGILDVRSFVKRCQATWLPAMKDKYPARTYVANGHTAQKEALLSMYEEQDYPDSLLYHFPSQLRLDALPELVDCSVSRSLLTSLLTALKANGSQGVFCEVQPTDRLRLEFLTKLGFLEIVRAEACSTEGLILGRLL